MAIVSQYNFGTGSKTASWEISFSGGIKFTGCNLAFIFSENLVKISIE